MDAVDRSGLYRLYTKAFSHYLPPRTGRPIVHIGCPRFLRGPDRHLSVVSMNGIQRESDIDDDIPSHKAYESHE